MVFGTVYIFKFYPHAFANYQGLQQNANKSQTLKQDQESVELVLPSLFTLAKGS